MRDLQEFSDQELIELAASEVGERKKAIAEEILRRRHQLRLEKWFGPKLAGLVSAVVTALSFFGAGLVGVEFEMKSSYLSSQLTSGSVNVRMHAAFVFGSANTPVRSRRVA